MANGKFHKKAKKPGRPVKQRPPSIEVLLGALWIKHEKYYKALDREASLVFIGDGSGEIRIGDTRIFRFKELEELYEWLSVR